MASACLGSTVPHITAAGDRGRHGRADQGGVHPGFGGELAGDEPTGQPAIRQGHSAGARGISGPR